MALTKKQQAFVAAYDGNPASAAKQAGYAGHADTLESVGRKNLANPTIKQAIDERRAQEQAESDDKPLTEKQQRFVDVYQGNATEAARLAGYKGNDVTLGQVGAENMKKPQIAEAIKERHDKVMQPHIASREERQQFWTKVARDGNADMKDRLRASELLGKSEADFIEKQEHSGPGANRCIT